MPREKKRPGSLPAERDRKEVRSPAQSATPARPLWAFRVLDLGGPYCWSRMDGATLLEVMGRLKHLEGMTWTEIEQSTGSHFVGRGDLIKSANERLLEIKQDDVDELFSLRIRGKARIWGIRDGTCSAPSGGTRSIRSAPRRRSTRSERRATGSPGGQLSTPGPDRRTRQSLR